MNVYSSYDYLIYKLDYIYYIKYDMILCNKLWYNII